MSGRLGRWAAHLLLALVVGLVAGTGAGVWLHHHRASERAALDFPPRSDQLDAAVAALRRDGVYVAPDAQTILGPSGRRRVAAAVATSRVPVYVAVLAPGQHVGIDEAQIPQVLEAELPDRPGVLFLWQGPGKGDIAVLGAGGEVPGFETAESFVGDPATTLTAAVHAAARTDFYTDYGHSDYWGGVPGGGTLGAIIAIGVTLVLLFVAWLVARLTGHRRLPGRWTPKEDPS